MPEGRPVSGAPGGDLLIGWDTCTLNGVLVVARGKEILADRCFTPEKGHTGRLVPHLESALEEVGVSLREVGSVAVGIGPGNFTGVKVGVATAKAVAMALGVPLIGIPTLDLLAAGAPVSLPAVVAVIDARRGLYYAGVYRRTGHGIERSTGFLCLEPGALAGRVLKSFAGPLAVVGEVPAEMIVALRAAGLEVEEARGRHPRPESLADIASSPTALEAAGTALSVTPIYLRSPT